ncbi:MAG: hypothetical protein Q9159_002785 [Coniocarpon cinnabarinum]
MHRSSAARSARIVRQNQSLRTHDAQVCLFCQHRTLTISRPHQDGRSESQKISDRERKRREGLSTTQKTLLARDRVLDRVRGMLWKGTPPGADDPYTGKNRPQREAPDRAERQKPVMIGGEDFGEVQMDRGQRTKYRRQLAEQEQERRQEAVDEAPEHKDYVPVTRWDGLEVVGGEQEWDVGIQAKPSKAFRSFLPKKKVASPALLTIALHRAAVEVWCAHSIGQDIMKLGKAGPEDLVSMRGDAHRVSLKPSQSGAGVDMTFPDQETRLALQNQISPEALIQEGLIDEAEEAVDRDPDLSPEEKEARQRSGGLDDVNNDVSTIGAPDPPSAQPWELLGHEWKSVPFSHPEIQLAIAHRLAQLTSHVLPLRMFQVDGFNTLGDVLAYLHHQVETPKSTFEQLVGTQYATENPMEILKPNKIDGFEPSRRNQNVVGPLSEEKYGNKGVFNGLSNVVIHDSLQFPTLSYRLAQTHRIRTLYCFDYHHRTPQQQNEMPALYLHDYYRNGCPDISGDGPHVSFASSPNPHNGNYKHSNTRATADGVDVVLRSSIAATTESRGRSRTEGSPQQIGASRSPPPAYSERPEERSEPSSEDGSWEENDEEEWMLLRRVPTPCHASQAGGKNSWKKCWRSLKKGSVLAKLRRGFKERKERAWKEAHTPKPVKTRMLID